MATNSPTRGVLFFLFIVFACQSTFLFFESLFRTLELIFLSYNSLDKKQECSWANVINVVYLFKDNKKRILK